jgi:ABC-type branched-subunit amino acid transport system substrate-binding protein
MWFSMVMFLVIVFGLSFTAQQALAAPEKILVGVCTGLTGPHAGFGEGGVFGIRAAVEDINKQGGVMVKEYGKKLPIELVVLDNEGDPAKAGTLAQSLILNDKVNFIVNGMDPPHMRAPIAGVTERYKVVHISGAGPYEAWMSMRNSVEKPWQYTWTPSFAIGTPPKPGDFREGKPGYVMMDTFGAALEMLAQKTNKKCAAFASDEPDGRGWYLGFSPFLVDQGWDVYRVKDEFGLVPMETTDFSSLIKSWKDNNCEVLWANAPGPFFGAMWRQARRMGYKPKMVYATRAGLFFSDVNAWGGDLGNGISNEMFWNPALKGCPGIGDTTPQSLFDRWQKKSKQPVNQNIGMGYQSIQILIDVIERAGTLNADDILKALKTTDLMTIYHRVAFDDENFSRHPVSFGQWVKKGKTWVNEVVITNHEFLPKTADLVFPIPY